MRRAKTEHRDETDVEEPHTVFATMSYVYYWLESTGFNYELVNGNARCSMRGIHWIEPVTGRLSTSSQEKVHPPYRLYIQNSRCA